MLHRWHPIAVRDAYVGDPDGDPHLHGHPDEHEHGHGYAVGHPDTDIDPHVHVHPDIHPDLDAYGDHHFHRDEYGHIHCNENEYTGAAHGHSHIYGHFDFHTDPDGDAHCHVHSDEYGHVHAYEDQHPGSADSDSHLHGDLDFDQDQYTRTGDGNVHLYGYEDGHAGTPDRHLDEHRGSALAHAYGYAERYADPDVHEHVGTAYGYLDEYCGSAHLDGYAGSADKHGFGDSHADYNKNPNTFVDVDAYGVPHRYAYSFTFTSIYPNGGAADRDLDKHGGPADGYVYVDEDRNARTAYGYLDEHSGSDDPYVYAGATDCHLDEYAGAAYGHGCAYLNGDLVFDQDPYARATDRDVYPFLDVNAHPHENVDFHKDLYSGAPDGDFDRNPPHGHVYANHCRDFQLQGPAFECRHFRHHQQPPSPN